MTKYLSAMREVNRDVRLVFIADTGIGLTFFGGIYTVLLNLYLLRMGFPTPQIGLVNSTGLLTVGVFAPLAGAVGSKWSLKKALTIGLSCTVVSMFLLPFADLLPASVRMPWVVTTFVAAYAGFTLYMVNISPYLMAATSPELRTHVFAVRFALFPVGAFAGSVVAGLLPGLFARTLDLSLDPPAAYRFSLMAGALLLVPAIAAAASLRDYRTSEDTPANEGSDASAARFGSSVAVTAIVICTALSFLHTQAEGVVRTFFNVYLDTELLAAPALIGTLSAAGQLLAAAASLATPFLTARFGVLPVITGGTALKAVALLSFAVVRNWAGAGLGFAAMIAASSFVRPPFIVLQQSMVDTRDRPAMSAATTAAAGLGFSLSAFAGGFVAASWGFRMLFGLAAVVALTTTLYVWTVLRPKVAYRS